MTWEPQRKSNWGIPEFPKDVVLRLKAVQWNIVKKTGTLVVYEYIDGETTKWLHNHIEEGFDKITILMLDPKGAPRTEIMLHDVLFDDIVGELDYASDGEIMDYKIGFSFRKSTLE